MKLIIAILKALIEALLGKTKEEEEEYNDVGSEDETKINPRDPFRDSDYH